MTYRLFEGRDYASIYQRYRFAPPEEVTDRILQYLDRKKGGPRVLAVDLGCGTGQYTRRLSPHFQEVVGIDISKSQLEEARTRWGFPNISYREGTAEELPFPDGSVDLLTAASAAHWFDPARFLAEASRVLKPRGCLALTCYTLQGISLHHQSGGHGLTTIFQQVRAELLPYTSQQVHAGEGKLEVLFSAIPFPDKERLECIPVSSAVSVRNLVGLIESFSVFQTFRREDQGAAAAMLLNTQSRFLEEMGASSPDAELEMKMEYYCILATKPG